MASATRIHATRALQHWISSMRTTEPLYSLAVVSVSYIFNTVLSRSFYTDDGVVRVWRNYFSEFPGKKLELVTAWHSLTDIVHSSRSESWFQFSIMLQFLVSRRWDGSALGAELWESSGVRRCAHRQSVGHSERDQSECR
jgi:hypothetical protein